MTRAQGLQGGLPAVRRGRLARAGLRSRVRRPGPARSFVNNALYEMLNSANQAWTMYPGLSHGAYECAARARHAGAAKRCICPKLVSGVWTGTMCLTEPHCGTDLGILRTQGRAARRRLLRDHAAPRSSSPAGEHDLAENIVHLVLARLPDAPKAPRASRCSSCRSSSPMPAATRASATASKCGSIEHKMGIHGNADLRDEPRRRERLARGRAEQGPERDVRDDERRAPGRGHAGPGPDRGARTRTR